MKKNQVGKILDMLIRDKSFRKSFESNREEVLKHFNLSKRQLTAFYALNLATLISAATEIFDGSGQPF